MTEQTIAIINASVEQLIVFLQANTYQAFAALFVSGLFGASRRKIRKQILWTIAMYYPMLVVITTTVNAIREQQVSVIVALVVVAVFSGVVWRASNQSK